MERTAGSDRRRRLPYTTANSPCRQGGRYRNLWRTRKAEGDACVVRTAAMTIRRRTAFAVCVERRCCKGPEPQWQPREARTVRPAVQRQRLRGPLPRRQAPLDLRHRNPHALVPQRRRPCRSRPRKLTRPRRAPSFRNPNRCSSARPRKSQRLAAPRFLD